MKKVTFFALLFLGVIHVAAQNKRFVNTYLSGHVNKMIYDQFSGFTSTGFGAGIQLQLNAKHKLKPQIDITGNLFSINKILFVFPDGTKAGPKQSVATIFAGLVYEPVSRLETGFSAGPAFYNDGTGIGIKPYIAYYMGKKKIVKSQISLTHIYVNNDFYTKNTGIISAGIALKLF